MYNEHKKPQKCYTQINLTDEENIVEANVDRCKYGSVLFFITKVQQ